MAQAVSKLTRAKAALILDNPFFASILLKRTLIKTDTVPTLAVDARGQIYYNEAFCEGLSVQELVWGLAHECMHVMMMHAMRLGARDRKRWNYATDAWINETLTESRVGSTIKGCVDIKGSKDNTSEEIYDSLPESPPDGGKGKGKGGDGGGQGAPDPYDNGLGDEFVDGPAMTQAEQSAVEAQIKVDIAEAAQAARMQGKLPKHLERMVEQMLEVKTPWGDILERFMTNVSSQDYSWSRPNRRFVAGGMYLPSMRNEATMGEMAIMVDTSGSVSDKELALFGGHINRVLETCKPEKLHVIYADAAVNKHVEFTPDDFPITLEAIGGGGTDFRPAFDYLEEKGIEPACAVYLTDLYGEAGEERDYPVLWAAITDVVAPWGETVRITED